MAKAVDLIGRAQLALGLNQDAFGRLIGSSGRTVQRWRAGTSVPSELAIKRSAIAVYHRDFDIAEDLAQLIGETLVSLGLVSPPAPPPPPPPSPPTPPAPPPPLPPVVPASPWSPDEVRGYVAQTVVSAAADALELPPHTVLPAIVAMLERAKAARISVDELLTALSLAHAADPIEEAQPRGRKSGARSEVR